MFIDYVLFYYKTRLVLKPQVNLLTYCSLKFTFSLGHPRKASHFLLDKYELTLKIDHLISRKTVFQNRHTSYHSMLVHSGRESESKLCFHSYAHLPGGHGAHQNHKYHRT